MGVSDDEGAVRARGWRTLAALHARLDAALEAELQAAQGLSVVEFTVLDALARQDGFLLRMAQVARAAALSDSATTRLVNRLEDRGLTRRTLCRDDRRGIYTELTDVGRERYSAARAVHDSTLASALAEAAEVPELRPLVEALAELVAPAG